MDIRLLTAEDIDACIDVFYEADEALTAGMSLRDQPAQPRGHAAHL